MVKFFKHLVILSLLKLNLYFALKKKIPKILFPGITFMACALPLLLSLFLAPPVVEVPGPGIEPAAQQ